MGCCKGRYYDGWGGAIDSDTGEGWCNQEAIVYKDVQNNEFCVFHAPQGEKGVSVARFNELIYERINIAINVKKACNLSETIFEGYISFEVYDNSNPLPKIDFSYSIFLGSVFFYKTVFDETNFYAVSFNSSVQFSHNIFNGKVSFMSSEFIGSILYSLIIFNEPVCFLNTHFKDQVKFDNCTFNNTIDFSIAKFYDELKIIGNTFNNKVNFSNVNLVEGNKFINVNISLFTFLDTDIKKIEFINCIWAKRRFGYFMLNDERELLKSYTFISVYTIIIINPVMVIMRYSIKLFEKIIPTVFLILLTKKMNEFIINKNLFNRKTEFFKVVILYRLLKENAKSRQNQEWISYWHYGEQEMLRKETLRTRFISIRFLYWLSSGYGESPTKAFIFFLILAVFFILCFGASMAKEMGNIHAPLITFNNIFTVFKTTYGHFLKLFISILQTAAFYSNIEYSPQNLWGKLFQLFAKVLLPIQAALFAFAVRNKYRR